MPGTGGVARRHPPWLAVPEGEPARLVPADEHRSVLSARQSRWRLRELTGRARLPLAAFVLTYGALATLWSAAVGSVLGALEAAGVLHRSGATDGWFDTGAGRGWQPWHVLAGALVGAGGTTATMIRAVLHTPWALGSGLGLALVSALAVSLVGTRLEAPLLRLRRCRSPSMAELRRISEAAQRFGVHFTDPEAPRVLVSDSCDPALRIYTRLVVLSTGLLDALDGDELAAVLCHGVHLLHVGAGKRRTCLLAWGWPVLALRSAVVRFTGARGTGAPHGADRLVALAVLWPAVVAVRFVLTPVAESHVHSEAYDADAAVRRAGLGPNLAAALVKLPRPWEVAGAGPALAGALPPLAVRLDRLAPTRPLDAFFTANAGQEPAVAVRARLAAAGAALGALLVAVGAGMSAANTSAGRAAAEVSAASFTQSYLDAAFDPGAMARTIRSFVPVRAVPGAELETNTSVLGVTAALGRGRVATSRATAVGCRYGSAATEHPSDASVTVRARWAIGLGAVGRRLSVTGVVPLRLSDGRWQPTGAPVLSFASDHTRSGFGPCFE